MVASGAEALFERELETAHLQRAVDHSWHGVGRLVVIEGQAGIGKTSLLGAARELAVQSGMNVRSARGAELEQSFPFGIVRQLLEPLIDAADEAERGKWLAGAAELAAPLFDPRAALGHPTDDSIYPRLHGLYWLCSNIAAERPLALLVDDAESMDEPSLAAVGFLARRLEEVPVLLVLAMRAADRDTAEPLLALRRNPGARVLSPRELSVASVESILKAQLGEGVEEGFARACHRATSGNPFLMTELIFELQERGISPLAGNAADVAALAPRRVADTVLARLGSMSPAAPILARAVAIFGEAGLADAAALAGIDEQTAIQAATMMRGGQLLSDQATLAFSHPIIRTAIYQSLLPAERVLRHAQAASLLHARGARAERVAAQVLLAEGLAEPWVLEELRLAADSALAMGAPRSAVAYLRRALELDRRASERSAILAGIGHAEVLAGLPEAADHLEEAVRLTPDPDERAKLAIELAQLLKYTGRVPRAVELLTGLPRPADGALAEQVETERLSGALMSYTAHEMLADRIAELEDPGRAAHNERERVELTVLAVEAMNATASKAEVLDVLTRAGTGLGSPDDRILLPPGLMTAAGTLSFHDEFDRAEAICNSVIERSRKRGALAALSIALSIRGQNAYRRGDLREALADSKAANRLASEVSASGSPLRLHPISTIDNVAVEQERSHSELQELLDTTDRSLHRDTLHGSITLLARARLLLAMGRPQDALDQLLQFARLPAAFSTRSPVFLAWRSDAALIMYQLGDRAGATRLAGEELELALASGASRALGVALRAAGLVQSPAAIDTLRKAVDVLQGSGARLEHARALVELGAAMRRGGERSASREPLREGYERAVRCGATKLAARAQQEIAASGARLSAGGVSGVASLTPSELRVAELAAQGQTNRDIAQTLFVSEKTVETHLGHVYDKLGVRSRHKLAGVLAQPDRAMSTAPA